MNDGFMDPQASFEELLESFGAAGEVATSEQVLRDFIESTPMLAPAERLQFLGEALEAAARSPSRGRTSQASRSRSRSRTSSTSNSFQSFARGLQAFTQIAQAAAPIVSGMATAFGGNNQTARDVARISGYVGQGAGMLGNITGQFAGQRPHPGVAQAPAPSPVAPQPGPPPAAARPYPFAMQAQVSPPGQRNSAALAHMMFQDPRFAAMLQQLAMTGRAEVALDLGPNRSSAVRLPASAVLNAAAALAADAADETPALEDYMIGENGEALVDPADRDGCAALVVEFFREAWDAERQGLTRSGGGGEADMFDDFAGDDAGPGEAADYFGDSDHYGEAVYEEDCGCG